MIETTTYSSLSASTTILKTPPRSQRPNNVSSSISSYRTPTKSGGSRSAHRRIRPRMSPSPYASFRRTTTPSHRTCTPSPSYGGDRFIPSRRGMNVELCRRSLLSGFNDNKHDLSDNDNSANGINNNTDNGHSNNNNQSNTSSNGDETPPRTPQESPIQKEYKRRMLSSLCNIPLERLNGDAEPTGLLSFGYNNENRSSSVNSLLPTSSPFVRYTDPRSQDTLRVLQQFDCENSMAINSSVGKDVVNRKIPSAPSRILDAPDLVDDYYLNLISWGEDNILAVALAQCVYLWNAGSGEIQHLTTIQGHDDYVTSVSWCTMPGHSKYIAVGTNSNTVQLWDAQAMRKVRTLYGHSGRVASIAWNQHWLTSGGRDSMILQHDVRSSAHLVSMYKGHEQEVCGLKWNDEGTTLASGGNENYLCIWDSAMSSSQRNRRNYSSAAQMAPRLLLTQHKAAVKALDWCPFHRGLLASGGGTADRTIKFWNSNNGAMLNSIDTGSQVCSILWSKHQRELCSSHGFSENQLILWKYGNGSKMTKVKEFTGHTSRVLSLASSPDGSTVVSAAGDETLRFWNIFGAPRCRRSSVLPMGDSTFGMPSIR